MYLLRVDNPGTNPTITLSSNNPAAINIGDYVLPTKPTNKDVYYGLLPMLMENPLNLTGGARIRDQVLYTIASFGFPNPGTFAIDRAGLRWFKLGMTSWPPPKLGGGDFADTVSGSSYYDYWMPSIAVSGQHHGLVGMSRIGATINDPYAYANAAITGGLNLDQPNSNIGSNLTRISASTYKYQLPSDWWYTFDTGRAVARWGDFSYVSVDPCDDMTFWTAQEFSNVSTSNKGWGVQVAQVRAPAPTISSVSPSQILNGVHQTYVTITGIGFYNPGTSISCHTNPVGTVSGVRVARTIYDSPTQIRLELNTCAVASGSKPLIVTNPDGQQATGALTVADSGKQCPTDMPSVYRPSTSTFLLKTAYTGGPADITAAFGYPNWFPVTGDWDGDGIDTIGVVNPSNGVFYLSNSNTTPTTNYSFVFGNPGDKPLAGKWMPGATHDGVGIFRPSNGIIYLKNELASGFSDYYMIFGNPGDVAIAGDWNGDNVDSPGIYRPSQVTFYLTDAVGGNGPVFSNYNFIINGSVSNDLPVGGAWTNVGFSGAGYYHISNGIFYLKNTLVSGLYDIAFAYGSPGDVPIAGHWSNAVAQPPRGIPIPNILVPGTAAPTQVPTRPPTRTPQPGDSGGLD